MFLHRVVALHEAAGQFGGERFAAHLLHHMFGFERRHHDQRIAVRLGDVCNRFPDGAPLGELRRGDDIHADRQIGNRADGLGGLRNGHRQPPGPWHLGAVLLGAGDDPRREFHAGNLVEAVMEFTNKGAEPASQIDQNGVFRRQLDEPDQPLQLIVGSFARDIANLGLELIRQPVPLRAIHAGPTSESNVIRKFSDVSLLFAI